MGVIYGVGADTDEESPALRDRMRADKHPDGHPVYSPLVGLSLMVFFALACQCMSTLAVVRRETGGWRWPLLQLAAMNALAYIVCLGVYQIGSRIFGF
jgi:ferrous iron transport protein B